MANVDDLLSYIKGKKYSDKAEKGNFHVETKGQGDGPLCTMNRQMRQMQKDMVRHRGGEAMALVT